MIRKLAFIITPLAALLIGMFGGTMLRSPSTPESEAATSTLNEEIRNEDGALASGKSLKASELSWFKFPNQFFIPLMRNGQVHSTMILSLTLEFPQVAEASIRKQEHRLRDALLRALMINANTGGFDGNFTSDVQMRKLRIKLLTAVHDVIDEKINDILIEDIARQ